MRGVYDINKHNNVCTECSGAIRSGGALLNEITLTAVRGERTTTTTITQSADTHKHAKEHAQHHHKNRYESNIGSAIRIQLSFVEIYTIHTHKRTRTRQTPASNTFY